MPELDFTGVTVDDDVAVDGVGVEEAAGGVRPQARQVGAGDAVLRRQLETFHGTGSYLV